MEDNLLIFRLIEYGRKNKYFSFSRLKADLDLKDLDEKYVWQSLTSWEQFSTQNPNHILVVVEKKPVTGGNREVSAKDYTLSLLPSAIVSYVDYLEIAEARRNSEQARIQANKAHKVSLWAIGISIIIGLLQILLEIIYASFKN